MKNKPMFSISRAPLLVGLLSLIALTACQTNWYPRPDERAAVQGAIRAQSVYPDGRPNPPVNGGGRDGETARKSIESYHRSYNLPTGTVGGAASPTTSPTPISTPTP